MYILLIILLVIISFACFSESKKDRKSVRLLLSITLALLLAFVIEGSAHSLIQAEVIEGAPLIILYYALPTISFTAFQLLLYDIRLMDGKK